MGGISGKLDKKFRILDWRHVSRDAEWMSREGREYEYKEDIWVKVAVQVDFLGQSRLGDRSHR